MVASGALNSGSGWVSLSRRLGNWGGSNGDSLLGGDGDVDRLARVIARGSRVIGSADGGAAGSSTSDRVNGDDLGQGRSQVDSSSRLRGSDSSGLNTARWVCTPSTTGNGGKSGIDGLGSMSVQVDRRDVMAELTLVMVRVVVCWMVVVTTVVEEPVPRV